MPFKAGIILCFCLGIFLLGCAIRQADGAVPMAAQRSEGPVAFDGIISVTQRYLELGLPIAGEWEIYRGSLLSPARTSGGA